LVIASGASGSCAQELALVELVASAFTFSLEQLNSIMRVIDDSMTRVRVLPTQPTPRHAAAADAFGAVR
jgi:hypothetical protein